AAGKHVWCEKPMAMDAAEGAEMLKACRDNRVQLAIGYRMQHEPNTRRFMAMAKERPYGRIVKLRADAGWFGWRDGADGAWRLDPARGGGAMYDMGVYCINAARYCTGMEPLAVQAWDETARRDLFKGVDETIRFRLEFPEDIVAECVTSFGRNLNTLQVDCERGWYMLSPFQGYEGNQGRASDGTVFAPQLGPRPRMQAEQMDQDALAILENRTPRAPGEEGERVLVHLLGLRAGWASIARDTARSGARPARRPSHVATGSRSSSASSGTTRAWTRASISWSRSCSGAATWIQWRCAASQRWCTRQVSPAYRRVWKWASSWSTWSGGRVEASSSTSPRRSRTTISGRAPSSSSPSMATRLSRCTCV